VTVQFNGGCSLACECALQQVDEDMLHPSNECADMVHPTLHSSTCPAATSTGMLIKNVQEKQHDCGVDATLGRPSCAGICTIAASFPKTSNQTCTSTTHVDSTPAQTTFQARATYAAGVLSEQHHTHRTSTTTISAVTHKHKHIGTFYAADSAWLNQP
jgi:hypothetical protein